MLSRKIYDFIAPTEASLTVSRQAFEDVRATGIARFETDFKNNQGEIFPAKVASNMVRYQSTTLVQTMIRDIKEHRRAEEARNRLLAIIESTPDFVGTATPDGRIFYMNQGARQMVGMTKDQNIVNYRIPDLHPEWASKIILEEGLPVAIRDGIWRGETSVLTCDGKETPVSQVIIAHFDDKGEPEYLSTIARDTSQQKHAEKEKEKLETQLRHSQKMEAIGQLAGGVAHDFNNILTVILGNIELADQSFCESPINKHDISEALKGIELSAKRAADLTRQLLAFGRRQVSQPRILNLNKSLEDVQKMMSRLLTENIFLEIACEPKPHTVRADPGQIEQIILNLAVNARDAMPDGGRLVIGLRYTQLDDDYTRTHADAKPGAHVLLSVSDNGHGMDANTQNRIFEPFFTTKALGQGTGLGLATVYGIVKQAGGHIVVYSEMNHGTTFKVYLPAVVGVETPVAATPETQTGTETILVCEDDDTVRRLTALMLRSVGYTVLSARGGAHSLEVLADHTGPLDMLLTDVVMPDMNGNRLADLLTAEHEGLKVLFMSGYTSNVIAHHGMLDEGVEFLEKPFSRSRLLQRVRQVLDS